MGAKRSLAKVGLGILFPVAVPFLILHEAANAVEAISKALPKTKSRGSGRRRGSDRRRGSGPYVDTSSRKYQEYIKSPEWEALRQKVLARDGYRCRHCGKVAVRLEIHHKTYKNFGHENTRDVITLCFPCRIKPGFVRARSANGIGSEQVGTSPITSRKIFRVL